MRLFTLAATALALSLSVVAHAAPTVQVNFTSLHSVPSNNNFKTDLATAGYKKYASTGASLILDYEANITFYFLGSESGYSDTFSTDTLSFTETSSYENHFAAPILIGTQKFAAGSLSGLLNFTSDRGAASGVGAPGFAIFTRRGQVTGSSYNTFYLGYDDLVTRTDNDHDDFIVMAVVSSVPEPGTWTMLLAGFALVGSMIRLRKTNAVFALA